MKKYNLLITSVASFVLSTSVLAAKVEIPMGDDSGTFSCKVNTLNPFLIVDIDTDNVEVKGFCKGQPYATQDGHIRSMPISELRYHYFNYKKPGEKNGSVTINTSSNDADAITCSEGQGDKTKSYGEGKYC